MSEQQAPLEDWADTAQALQRLHARQLFFLGGAPRSGTTWLQQMLDAHPDASCRGEGLFAKLLFPLLDSYLDRWTQELDAKNKAVFSRFAGYPLPGAEERHFLAATTILLALRRQAAGRDCLAFGEKTPENIFFLPALATLFPRAKFIAIARDPRDVITSAWHFFRGDGTASEAVTETEKRAFIQRTLPSLDSGLRNIIAHARAYPGRCQIVTYEGLRQAPEAGLAGLFQFLGLSDDPAIVARCIAQTRFEAATGGRPAGQGQNGAFLRKGIVGDWPSTLSPAMNDLVLAALGWSFPYFGWTA